MSRVKKCYTKLIYFANILISKIKNNLDKICGEYEKNELINASI
jgi:hypothetical protein